MQKGTYQAKVTVSDPSGATAAKTLQIVVGDPPGNVAPTSRRPRCRAPARHRWRSAERRGHRSRR